MSNKYVRTLKVTALFVLLVCGNLIFCHRLKASGFDANNYLVVEAESASPGLPNSSDNEDLINLIFSGESEGLFSNSVFLSCGSPQPSSDNNGEIQLYIESGVSPFQVEWSGASSGQEQLEQYEYELFLENLPSGNYQITVTDNRGCSSTCSTDVIPLNISTGTDENEICEGECQDIGSDLPNGMCYYWSLEHDFDDNTQQIQNVCPIENTNYSITVTDDDGNIIEIREYPVEVTPTETLIYPNPAMLCSSPEGLTLSVDGDWSQYEWSTEETTETIEVFSTGLYSVTVSNDDGCVATAEIEVKDPTQSPEVIEEYFTNLGFIILPVISIDVEGILPPGNGNGGSSIVENSATCNVNSYIPEDYAISFLEEYFENDDGTNVPTNLPQSLMDACSTSPDDITYYITNNDDFCNPDLIEEIEMALVSQEDVTWYHIFDEGQAKLIVGSNYRNLYAHYSRIESLVPFLPELEDNTIPPSNVEWNNLTIDAFHNLAVSAGRAQRYYTGAFTANGNPIINWDPYGIRLGAIFEASIAGTLRRINVPTPDFPLFTLERPHFRRWVNKFGGLCKFRKANQCPTIVGKWRQPDYVDDIELVIINAGTAPNEYWIWRDLYIPAMYNEAKIKTNTGGKIRLKAGRNPGQM